MISIVVTRYLDREAEREQLRESRNQLLRDRKIPVYLELLSAIAPMMLAAEADEKPGTVTDVTKQMATWGSNGVLLSYVVFRSSLSDKPFDSGKVAEYVAELIVAIREDLGYEELDLRSYLKSDTEGVLKGAIAGFFVEDEGGPTVSGSI